MPIPPSAYSSNIASADGSQRAFVLPYGQINVASDGAALFTDTFDSTTIDTVFRWNAAVLAGSGTVTQLNGSLIITNSTTTSNAGALSSQVSFTRQGFGWLKFGIGMKIEAASQANTHKFWGIGTPNASFTAATPLADAVGFEEDITGQLAAVIYAGNTRVYQAKLPYPTDGNPHAYVAHIRDDYVFWFVDNLEVPVAYTGWTSPTTNTLPIRLHAINHTVAPGVAPTFNAYGIGLADSSGSADVIFNGIITDRTRTPNKFINLNAVSIATEATIWTPATGKRFRVMGFMLTSGTVGGNVVFKDNTAGTTILTLPFGAAAIPLVSAPMGNGIFSAAINNVLTATGVATQTLSGTIFGCEE